MESTTTTRRATKTENIISNVLLPTAKEGTVTAIMIYHRNHHQKRQLQRRVRVRSRETKSTVSITTTPRKSPTNLLFTIMVICLASSCTFHHRYNVNLFQQCVAFTTHSYNYHYHQNSLFPSEQGYSTSPRQNSHFIIKMASTTTTTTGSSTMIGQQGPPQSQKTESEQELQQKQQEQQLQQKQPQLQTQLQQQTQTQHPGRGLSRYFQAILSRTNERQRFVTGKYPVIVTVKENPTQKWLNLGRNKDGSAAATSVILVNNTQLEKSLASYSRLQWLDDDDDEILQLGGVGSSGKTTTTTTHYSMELLAEIHMNKPGYVHIMPSDGAGSSAAALRKAEKSTRWNLQQRRSSALYQQMEDLKWEAPYRDRLWVSGFTLAGRKGIVKSMDVHSGYIDSVSPRSESMTLWPNEINSVPANLLPQHQQQKQQANNNNNGINNNPKEYHDKNGGHHHANIKSVKKPQMDDALLVSDGFLVPGKDRGGIYIVQKPGNPTSEWTICLTDRTDKNRWFYHRAMWIDLTGDGRQSILTARAKLRKVKAGDGNGGGKSSEVDSRPKNGQLVWLEMPKPHHFDEATGTPLEEDNTVFDPFDSRHLPWKERVLATGPDVMFNVADMDTTDDTIEVIASQFFDKKVTLHSIKKGPRPYISFSRVIDDRCGAAFGGTFADLDISSTDEGQGRSSDGKRMQQRHRQRRNVVLDSGGCAGTVQPGDSFSHLLVTSHECNYVVESSSSLSSSSDVVTTNTNIETSSENNNKSPSLTSPSPNQKSISMDGGSLFSYRVPPGKDGWKTDEWVRTTVASGFKVKGQLWNVINPGAPGFVYTFHAHKDDSKLGKRPMIAVAGDCAESAFIFRPDDNNDDDNDDGEPNRNEKSSIPPSASSSDPNAKYRLMCEIKCGATVGSIGIGYEDLCTVEQEAGYVKLYVPCYEKDKILVFALGSGEDATDYYYEDDGW